MDVNLDTLLLTIAGKIYLLIFIYNWRMLRVKVLRDAS